MFGCKSADDASGFADYTQQYTLGYAYHHVVGFSASRYKHKKVLKKNNSQEISRRNASNCAARVKHLVATKEYNREVRNNTKGGSDEITYDSNARLDHPGAIEYNGYDIYKNEIGRVIGDCNNTIIDDSIVDDLYEKMNKSIFSDQLINLLICYVALSKSEHKHLNPRFLDNKFKYFMVVDFLSDIIPDGIRTKDLFKEALLVFSYKKEGRLICQIGSSLDQCAEQIYNKIPSANGSWVNKILGHVNPGWLYFNKIFTRKSRHDLAVVYWIFLRMMHKERLDGGSEFNKQLGNLSNHKNTIYYNGEYKHLNLCPTYHIPMYAYILRGIIKFLATDETDHLGPIISKYQEGPSSNITGASSAFPQIDDQKSDSDDIEDVLDLQNDPVIDRSEDIGVSRSAADNLEKTDQAGIVEVERLPNSYKHSSIILEQYYKDKVSINSSSVPIDPNIGPAEMRDMLIGAIGGLRSSSDASIKIGTLINYYIFSLSLISPRKDFNRLFRDLSLMFHPDKKTYKEIFGDDFYTEKGYLTHYISEIKKAILCALNLKKFDQEVLVRESTKFKAKFVLACEHPAMLNRELEFRNAIALHYDLFELGFKHCCELIQSIINIEVSNLGMSSEWESYQRKMQDNQLEEMAKELEELDKQLKKNAKILAEDKKWMEEHKKWMEGDKKWMDEHKKSMEEQYKQIKRQSEEHKQQMKQQSNNYKKGSSDLQRRPDEFKVQIAPQGNNSADEGPTLSR